MRMRGHYFIAFWERGRHCLNRSSDLGGRLTVYRNPTPDAKEGDGF
jgi:hypothetical protein